MVTAGEGAVLSPAQAKFNTLMRRLEKARDRHRREQVRLDALLESCGRELLPLVSQLGRLVFDLMVEGMAALKVLKFSPRRRKLLRKLIRQKSNDLLVNPNGLTEDDIEKLRQIVEELSDPVQAQDGKKGLSDDFLMMLGMVEYAAEQAGLDLDLSGLDANADQAELEQEVQRRLDAAMKNRTNQPGGNRARKPTKAQQEQEKRQHEAQEAKQRDLKSLYKQLAKLLHPDLESEPERRLQKEEWMKRLTAAYTDSDLRELLCIEMEWMGVEATNLAQASDEKLKTYARVLQEQIDDLNFKTRAMIHQPQYAALLQFKHPIFDTIPPIPEQKDELLWDIRRKQAMLKTVRQGGPACQCLMVEWAEELAQEERLDACPF